MKNLRKQVGVEEVTTYAISNPNLIQIAEGHNERKQWKGIEELATSIREAGVGLLQPLIVRPDYANEDQPFILIDGERRLRALEYLYDKYPNHKLHISLVVRNVDEDQAKDIMARANLERESFTASEEISLVQNYQARGLSVEEIAKRLNQKDTRWVEARLVLSGASKSLKDAVDKDKITLSGALMLATRKRVKDQDVALAKVLRIAKGTKRGTTKAAEKVTGTKRRPTKREVVATIQSVAGADFGPGKITTTYARQLIIMALNYGVGEEDVANLLMKCADLLGPKAAAPKAPGKPTKKRGRPTKPLTPEQQAALDAEPPADEPDPQPE